MKRIKIITADRINPIVIPEDDFKVAMLEWCQNRFNETHAEIFLETSGVRRFAIVPFNENIHD